MAVHLPRGRDSVVDRAWSVAVRPEFIGLLLLIAGATFVVVATSVGGSASDPVGWIEPLRVDYAVPATAGLLGGAFMLWLGAAWDRWRRSDIEPDSETSEWGHRRLPFVGALLALLGGGCLFVGWFGLLSSAPPGEMSLAAGEKAESFQGRVAGEAVDVMFPYRVHLERVTLGERPTFEIGLSKPGNEPFDRKALGPGQSISVSTYRVTPVGLSTEAGQLRATFASTRDDTIKAVASSGESFQLRPEGPEYEVEKIAKNLRESFGPAARLSSEKHGSFWAFQWMPEGDAAPAFLHDVRVDDISKGAAVVFSVTPKLPMWPVVLGGGLLVLGFAMCLVFPERVRIARAEGLRVESFNESGPLVDDRRVREGER